MKLPDFAHPYLTGVKFSNSLTIPIDFKGVIPSRTELLEKLVKGKTVVHVGCLDHKELIDAKIEKRQWLHGLLEKSASNCVGIDINQETYEYLKTTHHYTGNIIIADVLKNALPQITSSTWDYIVLGELLEHIDNPVEFLSSLKKYYGGYIQKIIITVPNGFTQSNFRNSSNNKEVINSDHRFWFTPYTLARVMYAADILPDEFHFSNRIRLTTTELIKRKLIRLAGSEPVYNFTYASSIVAVGNL